VGKCITPVVGDVDRDPLAPQPGRKRLGQHLVIVDKQDSHRMWGA